MKTNELLFLMFSIYGFIVCSVLFWSDDERFKFFVISYSLLSAFFYTCLFFMDKD